MLYSITQDTQGYDAIVVRVSDEDGSINILKGDLSTIRGYRFTSRVNGMVIKFDPDCPNHWEELCLATRGRNHFSCKRMSEDELL